MRWARRHPPCTRGTTRAPTRASILTVSCTAHRCRPALESIRTLRWLPVSAHLGLDGAAIGLDPGRLLLSLSASTACSVVKRKSGHRRARFRACCPQVPWLAWTVELDSVNNVCVGEAIGQGALIPCDGGSEAPRSPARRRRHARPVRYSLSNYLPEPADRCSTTRTAIPESIPD
jgi:hypothetical protein